MDTLAQATTSQARHWGQDLARLSCSTPFREGPHGARAPPASCTKERIAVARQRVHRRSYRSPQRNSPGDLCHGRKEGLDHDRPAVAHGVKGAEDLVPWHVTTAWGTSVVLCGLHVEQPVPCRSYRRCEAFLLDVHVESVEEEPDVVATNPSQRSRPSSTVFTKSVSNRFSGSMASRTSRSAA